MTKRSAVDQIEFMRNLLAFLLVGSFVSMLPLFAFVIIPTENKEIIVYMVGQLSGMALTALGFYFVSKVGQDALDAKRSENTGKAFEAINKVAEKSGLGADAAEEGAQQTADAAQDEADAIKGNGKKGKG